MDIIVTGARLVDANGTEMIISYHDECCMLQNIASMPGKLMDKEDR
jgi:hypothetical protein